MCSWDKLPVEVIYQILIYLKEDYSTLQHCQLLCRTWHDPALKQMYKRIELEHVHQAKLFLKAISVPANYASKFVRSLCLGKSLCESPSIEFIFPRLFELCPNITRLEAPPGQSSSFWAKLLLEHSKGNVSHLREIPLTDLSNDDNIKLYGYTAYLLRNHLTNLTMCDWPSRDPSFQDDIVAQQLRDFRHLKHISIHLRGSKSIYEVFSFIQTCSTLKTIDISMTDINRKIHNYVEENDLDPNLRDIEPRTSPSQVERLNVEYIPITSKIIQYIIHLFPNLKELYFKSDNPTWEEDMELLFRVQTEGLRISTELWLEFLFYLYQHVPKFQVSNLFINNIPEVLTSLLKRTNYGETMKLIYLERDTFFDFQPFVGIDHNTASKKFTRGWNFYDHRTIEVVYAVEEDHYDILPHLSVLEKVGYNLKGLEIQIHEATRFADRGTELFNMACGYFIDHTIRCCPLLNTLSLNKCYLLNCDPNLSIGESVQVLRIINSKVSNTEFLSDISKRLPHLSYLVLHQCIFIEHEAFDYSDDDSSYVMFDMLDTSLDTLRITGQHFSDPDEVHLNIRTKNAEFFFVINRANQITQTSEPIFASSVPSDQKSIVLLFTDIKTLVFEMSYAFDVVIRFKGKSFTIINQTSAAYTSDNKEIQ